jgi:hypothetical protein
MTTENNKLIAEFLDNVFKVSTFKGELVIENIQSWKHYEDYDEIEFDFNLLMQVVEKIEKEHEFNTKLWYNRTRKDYQMQLFYTDFEKDIIVNSKSKIEAVYNACIEFIKWYNENKI